MPVRLGTGRRGRHCGLEASRRTSIMVYASFYGPKRQFRNGSMSSTSMLPSPVQSSHG